MDSFLLNQNGFLTGGSVSVAHYLVLAFVLFSIGALGVIIRKNLIVVLMCIELMLNAVNITFAAFSKLHGNLDGQVIVFFSMAVAAAEAAVGLSIILALFRAYRSTESVVADQLKF